MSGKAAVVGVPKCIRLLGHKFEARYDVGPAQAGNIRVHPFNEDKLPAILAATRPSTYLRDVCVHCGHVIERNGGDAALATVTHGDAQ